MRLAIVGSRDISFVELEKYLPDGITEIVSGGARGIDCIAANYAKEHGILLTEFLPDYACYGKVAPLKRNEKIANYADEALAFWDGCSRGTEHVIRMFRQRGKHVSVILVL